MKQQQTIRFGIIGCGYWGPNFVRIVQQTNGVELIAIADVDPEKINSLSQKHPNTICTTAVDEVIQHPDIDAIIISTPVSSHYGLVSAALKAGKHVLCEKPLALTTNECNILERLAEMESKVLLVGHVFEYNRVVRYMKQAVASGKIGDVLYLSLLRTGLGPVRSDVNVTYDLAAHDISIILALLEQMPIAVSANGSSFIRKGIEDVAFATLEFANDLKANISVSWIDPIKQRQVKVVGSKKMLLFDDVSVSEKLKVFETGKDYQTDSGDFGSFQLSVKDGDIVIPNIPFREPLLEEFEHFVACIHGQEQPLTNAKRAGKVVTILEAIQDSLNNNGLKIRL